VQKRRFSVYTIPVANGPGAKKAFDKAASYGNGKLAVESLVVDILSRGILAPVIREGTEVYLQRWEIALRRDESVFLEFLSDQLRKHTDFWEAQEGPNEAVLRLNIPRILEAAEKEGIISIKGNKIGDPVINLPVIIPTEEM